jgi:hypothetical protein
MFLEKIKKELPKIKEIYSINSFIEKNKNKKFRSDIKYGAIGALSILIPFVFFINIFGEEGINKTFLMMLPLVLIYGYINLKKIKKDEKEWRDIAIFFKEYNLQKICNHYSDREQLKKIIKIIKEMPKEIAQNFNNLNISDSKLEYNEKEITELLLINYMNKKENLNLSDIISFINYEKEIIENQKKFTNQFFLTRYIQIVDSSTFEKEKNKIVDLILNNFNLDDQLLLKEELLVKESNLIYKLKQKKN